MLSPIDVRRSCASQLPAFASNGWARVPTAGELFNSMVSLDERRYREGTCPRGLGRAALAAEWEREDANRTPKNTSELDSVPQGLLKPAISIPSKPTRESKRCAYETHGMAGRESLEN